MKNSLIKEDRTGIWIAAAIGGALAAGAGIWYYFRAKRLAELEAYQHEHAQDYLVNRQPKKKKHKTDVKELNDLVQHYESKNL